MGVGADQRDLHRLVRSTIADPASELSAYRPDRAAGLDERTSSQPPKRSGFCSRGWLRGSEKGSGCKRAIRARDVRAADRQEEPTKPPRAELIVRQLVSAVRRRRWLPANIAASAASHLTQRAQRAEQSNA